MNEFIMNIIALEGEEISYEQFSELHELWKVVSKTYFVQIERKGDILNAAGLLEGFIKQLD